MDVVEKLRFVDDDGREFPEWDEVTLGEVLIPVHYKKVAFPKDHDLLTVRLHTQGVIATNNHPNVTENGRPYYQRSLGEILIGKQNFHNGGIGIVGADADGHIASNAIAGYTTTQDSVYVLEYLKSSYKESVKYLEGTGQKEIPQKVFESLPIPLPSLPEQKKIAEFLGNIDALVNDEAEVVKLWKDRKRAWSQRIFTRDARFSDDDGREFPEWEEVTLGEVADVVMGQSPRGSLYNTDEVGKPLVQGNADINKGFVSTKMFSKSGNKECVSGDILLSVRAPVGPCIVSDANAFIGRGVCAIKGNGFIFQFLKRMEENGSWERESQGSTFRAISSKQIRELIVPFPSLPEQKKIAEFLGSLDENVAAHECRLAALKDLKRAYSQRIFA